MLFSCHLNKFFNRLPSVFTILSSYLIESTVVTSYSKPNEFNVFLCIKLGYVDEIFFFIYLFFSGAWASCSRLGGVHPTPLFRVLSILLCRPDVPSLQRHAHLLPSGERLLMSYHRVCPWISILYTDWFYAFGWLSKKGQNLFGILVSSLLLTELNTFIIAFY